MKNWCDERKLEYAMKIHQELNEMYLLISQMAIIAIRKRLKMVIENPYTPPHYLTSYWCLKPKIIDKDRSKDGDFYKKPTQYYFIGFEPKNNLVFEPIEFVQTKTIDKVTNSKDRSRAVERSMIHPQYARRFILKYLVDGKNKTK